MKGFIVVGDDLQFQNQTVTVGGDASSDDTL